jgi:hypothetical protein
MLIRLISPSATVSEKIIDALAINTTFTLAFTSFFRRGEFTYPALALVNRHCLQQELLTIPRVSLATDHLLLVVPKSKTDNFNQGITIRVARVGDAVCASGHMEKWLASCLASKWPPLQTPIFEFTDGTPFLKEKLVDILCQRLVNIGEPPTRFAGHSF